MTRVKLSDLLISLDRVDERLNALSSRMELLENVSKNILIQVGELKEIISRLSNNGGLNEIKYSETSAGEDFGG